MKYVDDLSLAEAISFPDQLVFLSDGQRPLPDTFHEAEKDNMKLNYEKNKLILSNPFTKRNFQPRISIYNHELKVVDEIRNYHPFGYEMDRKHLQYYQQG